MKTLTAVKWKSRFAVVETDEEQPRTIARCACEEDESEAIENARFIAAAPELLQALQRLEMAARHREGTMGDPSRLIECRAELREAATAARAAIAKATEQD